MLGPVQYPSPPARGVERIEHAEAFSRPGAILNPQPAYFNGRRADPEITSLSIPGSHPPRCSQIQKYLLKLVRVRGGHGQIRSQIIVNAHIAEAQRRTRAKPSVSAVLVELHRVRSGLCGPRKTQKVLDDSWVRCAWLIELVRISLP